MIFYLGFKFFISILIMLATASILFACLLVMIPMGFNVHEHISLWTFFLVSYIPSMVYMILSIFEPRIMKNKVPLQKTIETCYLKLSCYYFDSNNQRRKAVENYYPQFKHQFHESGFFKKSYNFKDINLFTSTNSVRNIFDRKFLEVGNTCIPISKVARIDREFLPYQLKISCMPPAYSDRIVVDGMELNKFILWEKIRARQVLEDTPMAKLYIPDEPKEKSNE